MFRETACMKHEPENELSNADRVHIKEESEWTEESRVKEEPSCLDSECGVSEAAILAGLYSDHTVKDELVLGPELPHRPELTLVLNSWALADADGCVLEPVPPEPVHGQKYRPRESSVRLERLHSDALLAVNQRRAPADIPTYTDKEFDTEDDIHTTVDVKKEPISSLCCEMFTVKADLVKHVQHMPVNKNQERYEKSSIMVRDCCVLLERCDVTGVSTISREPAGTSLPTTPEHEIITPQKHDTIQHPANTNIYLCNTCGKTYTNKQWLISHIHYRKPNKIYKCHICNKLFSWNSALKRYELLHSGVKPFPCSVCRKEFVDLSGLKRHKIIHNIENLFSCEICNKKYTRLKSLMAHNRIHTGDMYSCQICERKFTHLFVLKNHELIHTGEKPHSCGICQKKFRFPGVLKIHERLHSGARPYSCEICKKKFVDSSNFTKHKRCHTGEKPYSCEICQKRFITQSKLKRHQRIHTGIKPYSCKICTKEFNDSSNLKAHEQAHTDVKPYDCEICKKKYARAASLRVHKRKHTGEKRYSCQVCKKSFMQSGNLSRHKLTHSKKTLLVRNMPKKVYPT